MEISALILFAFDREFTFIRIYAKLQFLREIARISLSGTQYFRLRSTNN